MRKLKVPNLVTIAILTVITVVFWIAFGVFRIFSAKSETSVPNEVLIPLDPTLDKDVVDKIGQRIYFDKGLSFETVPVQTATPEPEVSEPVVASPSASPEPATGSGEIIP
jgi:hypothetical protein